MNLPFLPRSPHHINQSLQEHIILFILLLRDIYFGYYVSIMGSVQASLTTEPNNHIMHAPPALSSIIISFLSLRSQKIP